MQGSECKKLLLEANIDAFSQIDFSVNDEVHTLSFEYIIDTFMQASPESQEVFTSALTIALDVKEKEKSVEKFFEGMGQLLLMTHLSEKIEA